METSEHTRNLAKRLRRRMNEPELRLWSRVRANRLGGVHIRRQHPLGPYVLDFFCARARLAIEVDGAACMTRTEGRATKPVMPGWHCEACAPYACRPAS